MSRTRLFALLACFCVSSLTPSGCTAPVEVGAPTDGMGDSNADATGDMNTNGTGDANADGSGGTSAQADATAESATRAILSVIIARNEDRRAASDTLRAQVAEVVACPFGGSRSTGADNVTQFDDCVVLPGVTLNGGLRFTPGAEGTQGGRIEFVDFVTGNGNDSVFMIDGTIEETENPDDSLSFTVDARTTSILGADTDIFNLEGEVTVDEDGLMDGNLKITAGSEGIGVTDNDCNFTGINVFAFQDDPSAIDAACGFDEEDDEFDDQTCDCPAGQDCIPIEEDGVFRDLCNNCETDQDCIQSGLGNECAFNFGCVLFECFSDAECDDGFECVNTVTRGGSCKPL